MPFRSSPSAATDAALLSSEEVIARLEQGFRENAMLAFDADGTLWSGDIGVETFETVLERRALRQHALEALQAEAQLYDVPLYADVNDQARQLHEAYQGGRYPEERAFPMMAWVFAMSPVVENDVLQPRVREPITYAAGKTAALRAAVPDKVLLGAFGDSSFDAAMLREAKVAVCVRPKPNVFTGA